jgi:hypothetical protein
MESSVVAILLIIATFVLALGAFAFYSVSFSYQYYTVSVQEYLIGISKLISFETSQLTYAGIPSCYNYFNVSYVIWIQSPTKTVTVVPFVASPQLDPSYIFPSSPQNASLFASSLNGYSSLRPFNLNATVYLPQEGLALANVHVVAYNVSSNSTYVLSAVVRPSQIIMLWILYYYDGKWYRLDYVYLSPFNSGVGVYIITGDGIYKGYSGTLNNMKPYICIPDAGFQLGMWFEATNIQQSPTRLLNATFIPYNLHAENQGYKITVILYTRGSSLYANVYANYYETGKLLYNQTKLIYNNLKVGQPYFINISCGDPLHTDHHMTFTIYNKQGKLLNTTVVITNPETSGDTLILTFGSNSISNGIYQAFIDTLKNQQGINSFWNISSFILHNGPLYNDTYLFNWTVAHNPNLNSSAYWYFVWPYDNPSPQLPSIVWYWPSSTLKYPDIYYIPEIGTNSYVVV